MRDEKVRVLHFMGSGRIGGQERALYQLFKAFSGNPEIELTVAFGNTRGMYAEKIRELGINTIPIQIKSGFSLRFSRKFIGIFKQYDIHHMHDPSPNTAIYSLLAGNHVKRVVTRRGGVFDPSALS